MYNSESLQRALDELRTLDLDGAASLDRPDMEWEVYMICHVTFYVYDTGYILASDQSESGRRVTKTISSRIKRSRCPVKEAASGPVVPTIIHEEKGAKTCVFFKGDYVINK